MLALHHTLEEKRLTIAVADAGREGYRSIISVDIMLKIAVAVNAAIRISLIVCFNWFDHTDEL
jgi:hypothetical protein